MAQKKLLTNGNIFRRTDARWGGVVRYLDEQGETKRKSFSGTSKQEVRDKIRAYITAFNSEIAESDESKRLLKDSLRNWLQVFKYPSVERTTYDRLECTAKNQVLPYLGEKVVGDITAADVKSLLNRIMTDGYAYSTAKKVYHILTDYFRYMTQEGYIDKNPMTNAPMIKKANYLSSQNKENLPTCETVTVFTPEEIEKFKAEAYRCWGTGKRFYQQSSAYILMLNTGLRAGEALGLLNRDVDVENKVLHVRQGVKEVVKRDGMDIQSGTELRIGKLKTATSKRDVPLNSAAIEAINELRREFYFGEDAPLIPDENGDYTRPNNFRKRFHRILEAAGIEIKGLHSLRHTFATTLVNGVPQPDGTIKSLSPRQVADLLGHSTSEITEMYYVKKDTARLGGITNGFEI